MEGDGGKRLVFGLNLHPLFGLDSLVQPIAPTATGHQPPCEFINDDDLAVLHHVMLIPVVHMMGTKRCIQMVHQGDIGRVVKRGTFGQ